MKEGELCLIINSYKKKRTKERKKREKKLIFFDNIFFSRKILVDYYVGTLR